MTRTLRMDVAASRIATAGGPAKVGRSTPAQPAPSTTVDRRPAPAQAPVPAPVKTERVKVLAHVCIQPNCRAKHALTEWGALDRKPATHFCRTCGSVMAVAVVHMPPVEVQVISGAEAVAAQARQAPNTTVGSHAPGTRSAKLLAAMERKLLAMVKDGAMFTNEHVTTYIASGKTDLIEAVNDWLLVTPSKAPFIRSVKEVAEGQRTVGQIRGALNFWRAEVARKNGIKIEH